MHVHIHTHTCIHINMYTYTYTYTYIHTWIHIHTHTHMHVHIHIYIYICLYTHIYIYIYIYIYRIYTSCRERETNMYADVHNICLTYTPTHSWCTTTPVNTCGLCAKNAYGLVYARLFNCAAASLPRRLLPTYLKSCANIVQAVVYCPPYSPPSSQQSVVRRVRSGNPSKSTVDHDAVATVVLHKHHLIICVGAGLI